MARRSERGVFDQGVWSRSRWRAFRRKLLFVALVLSVVEFVGLPEVRLRTAGAKGPAVYFGVAGLIRGGGHAAILGQPGQIPLVRIVPLKESLIEVGKEALDNLWLGL